MSQTWEFQEAERWLDEVVDAALRDGPQVITRCGAEAVVVAASEYRALLERRPLSQMFRAAPLGDAELDLTRDTSSPRDEAVA